jgi:hypothetical protein
MKLEETQMEKLERLRPFTLTRTCNILLIFILGCVPTRYDSPLSLTDSTKELRIEDYTGQCLAKLNIAAEDTPQFSCSKGIYYKRYSRDEHGAWKSASGFGTNCINPDGANNRNCTAKDRVGAATYLTVNASNNLIAFVTLCTDSLLQVIAHRFDTGDTCFFEGRSESKLNELDRFRQPKYYYTGGFAQRSCVTCHSPYPFTNTPLIRTSKLLHRLGISELDDDVKAWSQMQDIPVGVKRLAASGLLNGKSPTELRALYDEHKSKILEIEGTPSNVFLDSDQNWDTLKYKVVAKDELEAISAPGIWDIDHYKAPALEPCQACHKLSARHHNARTAALVMGHCDVPEKADALCRGFDRTTLDIHLNGLPHNTLYGTALRKNPGIEQGINEFVNRCIGKKSEGCVHRDGN